MTTAATRLKDKVCVITGGASGIGLASAKRLAEEGAKVVIADLDEARGQEVAEELGGLFVRVNVADEEDVKNLFDTTVEHYGRVDVAFNNAGINPTEDNSILTTDLAAWQKVQTVNLTSVFLCCKYALTHMVRQRSGSVINTASFVALMGAATSQISYSASK
ncbi:short-chain dehydrogenase, partial [Burkholderia multivorans]